MRTAARLVKRRGTHRLQERLKPCVIVSFSTGKQKIFYVFFSYSPRWHRSPAFMRNKTPFFVCFCFCFCCHRCFGCCLTCMCACLVKQCISFREGTGNLFFFFAGSRLSRLSFLRSFLALSCINDSVRHFFFFFC